MIQQFVPMCCHQVGYIHRKHSISIGQKNEYISMVSLLVRWVEAKCSGRVLPLSIPLPVCSFSLLALRCWSPSTRLSHTLCLGNPQEGHPRVFLKCERDTCCLLLGNPYQSKHLFWEIRMSSPSSHIQSSSHWSILPFFQEYTTEKKNSHFQRFQKQQL